MATSRKTSPAATEAATPSKTRRRAARPATPEVTPVAAEVHTTPEVTEVAETPVVEVAAPAAEADNFIVEDSGPDEASATPEKAKVKKPKLVRDSFTIPKTEYVVLEELKDRAAQLALPVKKSELLRAGIKALAAMSDAAFAATLGTVPTIKTGRPKTEKV